VLGTGRPFATSVFPSNDSTWTRGTVLRAYDFANRDEAAAAAREGRKPTRPPYKWSNESRAAKRKSRGA